MPKLKVINLFGGPGSGKSTAGAGLFNLMKLKGHNVELVTEVAKDLTYEKHWQGLSNQLLILAHQDQRLRRLEGQVEWVITDSPLPTGIAYMGDSWKPWLEQATWSCYDQYHNFHILLTRGNFKYQPEGRNQKTLEAAMVIDNVLDNIFHTATIEQEDRSFEFVSDSKTPYLIYNWLMDHRGTA